MRMCRVRVGAKLFRSSNLVYDRAHLTLEKCLSCFAGILNPEYSQVEGSLTIVVEATAQNSSFQVHVDALRFWQVSSQWFIYSRLGRQLYWSVEHAMWRLLKMFGEANRFLQFNTVYSFNLQGRWKNLVLWCLLRQWMSDNCLLSCQWASVISAACLHFCAKLTVLPAVQSKFKNRFAIAKNNAAVWTIHSCKIVAHSWLHSGGSK